MQVERPENAKLLAYLKREVEVSVFAWYRGKGGDIYYKAGCHPDIVERLWDQIGPALPADCRCLVYGTPALAHPNSGVILATGMGTAYSLRLNAPFLQAAIAAGARTSRTWSTGETIELETQFGADWIFGAWLTEEPAWCRQMFETWA
jgi:hypothetical protein